MSRSATADWQKQAARKRRRGLSRAERLVWHHLRAHRLDGLGFRRQAPLGPHIAAFVCHERRLILEIDVEAMRPEHAIARERWFAAQGYRVLRLREAEILADLPTVLRRLRAAAAGGGGEPPLPGPPPQGGREQVAPPDRRGRADPGVGPRRDRTVGQPANGGQDI